LWSVTDPVRSSRRKRPSKHDGCGSFYFRVPLFPRWSRMANLNRCQWARWVDTVLDTDTPECCGSTGPCCTWCEVPMVKNTSHFIQHDMSTSTNVERHPVSPESTSPNTNETRRPNIQLSLQNSVSTTRIIRISKMMLWTSSADWFDLYGKPPPANRKQQLHETSVGLLLAALRLRHIHAVQCSPHYRTFAPPFQAGHPSTNYRLCPGTEGSGRGLLASSITGELKLADRQTGISICTTTFHRSSCSGVCREQDGILETGDPKRRHYIRGHKVSLT
jgi:hypothetical protein